MPWSRAAVVLGGSGDRVGRMVRGDVRGRRFGRLLQLELDEGVVEFHLRGVDEAVATIGSGPSRPTP
jgi:hypothetical protein